MPKAFQVSVLNFVFDHQSADAVSQYQMRTADGRKLNERQTIFILELPKIEIEFSQAEDFITTLTPAERWCTFLKYADDPEKNEVINSLCKAEAGIMAASTVLSEISRDEAAWLDEFARDAAERDHRDLVCALEEAKAELARVQTEKDAELTRLRAQLAALQK